MRYIFAKSLYLFCTIIISFFINFNGKNSVIYYRRFVLVSVCEKYASEFDILFNGRKSKLLFFKGRFSNGMESGIMVNGEIVNISDNAVHLGHTISSSDRESISLTAKSSFWKSFKSFISIFGHTYSFIKCSVAAYLHVYIYLYTHCHYIYVTCNSALFNNPNSSYVCIL